MTRAVGSAFARRWKRGISSSIRQCSRERSEDALGEQAARAERTGVLDTGAGVADRQGHLRGLGRHAELGEEPQQGGVGPAVVDDEAGVDGQLAVGGRDAVGVGVAAEAVVGLVEGHVRGARGHPGSGEPRHAGADDGDPLWRGGGAHVASVRSKTAIGSLVGCLEPPSGSTVMPTAAAAPADPSRTTVWSGSSGISPAETNSSPSMNHSS